MYHLVNKVGNPNDFYMIVKEKKGNCEGNKRPSIIPLLCACLTSVQFEKLT